MPSKIQRFFLAIFPRAWAEEMRAESQAWQVRCTCGFQRSIWELGGILWKAKRRKRWSFVQCPACGRRSWHTIYKAEGEDAA